MAGFMDTVSRETREFVEWEHEDKIADVYGKHLDAKASQESAKAAAQEAKASKQKCMALTQECKSLDKLIESYYALDPTSQKYAVMSAFYKKRAKELFDIDLA